MFLFITMVSQEKKINPILFHEWLFIAAVFVCWHRSLINVSRYFQWYTSAFLAVSTGILCLNVPESGLSSRCRIEPTKENPSQQIQRAQNTSPPHFLNNFAIGHISIGHAPHDHLQEIPHTSHFRIKQNGECSVHVPVRGDKSRPVLFSHIVANGGRVLPWSSGNVWVTNLQH